MKRSRAIIWTLVLATILYIGTTTAVLIAVPIETLAVSAAPLSLVFDAAPESVRQTFSAVAIVATINGVLIQMIMASRVLYGLADRGHLPAAFAVVSHRTRTPVLATVTVVLIILLLAWALPIEALAERTSQIVLFIFVVVNASLIRLKRTGNGGGQYFQVPMLVPVLGIVSCVLLFATAFI